MTLYAAMFEIPGCVLLALCYLFDTPAISSWASSARRAGS